MSLQSIDEQYRQTIDLLDDKRMKDAFTMLDTLTQACGDYRLQDELQAVQTSYHYMLQYMEQGMIDPSREMMYHDLLVKTYELADQIHLASQENLSQHYYFFFRKQIRLQPSDITLDQLRLSLESFTDSVNLNLLLGDEKKLMQDLQAHETALYNLFLTTWTNSRWNSTDRKVAYLFFDSANITSNDLSLFISAVTMSLISCFDEAKMLWLMEAFYHKDTQVKIRAQVGFVLVTHIHHKRISLYPGILARISLIQEEQPSFIEDINDIFIQLLRSQDTERINKTMKEEIVPEVMKKVKDMQQHRNIMDDSEDLDMNPDWMFDLGDKLNSKMRKIGELQQEGGDINMATFSLMKRFKFFEDIANWFYPFEPLHSSVISTLGIPSTGKNKVELLFLQMGFFCNSDSYSLIFMMQQMPKNQRKMLLDQISSTDIDMLIQESSDEKYSAYAYSPAVISRSYIQDLYRFYKLSPFKSEFHDVFLDNLALYKNPILKPMLLEPHLLQKAADFLFKTEKYAEAVDAYANIISLGAGTVDIFQRSGFCEQKLGNYEKAINYFEKADIANIGNSWTVRHMAVCYRHLSESQKALKCYDQLLQNEPDNLSFLYGKACCLMGRENYDEALKCFYQMDLAQDDNVKAWRGIAWCSFKNGNLKQAQKYYERIIGNNPTSNDWLNAGHVAWCKGNLQQAIERYRESLRLAASPKDFRTSFIADKELLEEKGISPTDFILILDLI